MYSGEENIQTANLKKLIYISDRICEIKIFILNLINHQATLVHSRLSFCYYSSRFCINFNKFTQNTETSTNSTLLLRVKTKLKKRMNRGND